MEFHRDTAPETKTAVYTAMPNSPAQAAATTATAAATSAAPTPAMAIRQQQSQSRAIPIGLGISVRTFLRGACFHMLFFGGACACDYETTPHTPRSRRRPLVAIPVAVM